jgi:hypothetical protein
VTITFDSGSVWAHVSKELRKSRKPSYIAVAYFGRGADKLIPVSAGSWVVVDASLSAVKAGQTHPVSLLKLIRRGVRVFSVENLHAKVFVTDQCAFVGSANASTSSEKRLIEALVCIRNRRVIAQARRFVREHCLEELSPKVLTLLQRSYRPPRFQQQASERSQRRERRVRISRLHLAQLKLISWPDQETDWHQNGLATARSKKEHRSGWDIQSFRLTGLARIQRGELVAQVVNEGRGRMFVEPPGKVLNVIRRRTRRGRVAYVYVEVPKISRRPRVATVARQLGAGAKRALSRDGWIRNTIFAQELLKYWAARQA